LPVAHKEVSWKLAPLYFALKNCPEEFDQMLDLLLTGANIALNFSWLMARLCKVPRRSHRRWHDSGTMSKAAGRRHSCSARAELRARFAEYIASTPSPRVGNISNK
jgi:hypothetical protein